MNDEKTPIEPPRARNADPDTSFAAERANKRNLTRLRRRILRMLLSRGSDGATTREMHEMSDIDHATLSPRMRPLVDEGYIVATGLRRVASKGRGGIVWCITGKGINAAREEMK